MNVRIAALWAMSSQYVAFAIQLATSIYLARNFITPDALGLFSIAFAAANLIGVLQDFGLTRYVVGEKDLTPEVIRTAFSLSIMVAWVIALLIVGAAWPLSALYGNADLLPLMLIFGASYFIVPLAIVPTALLQRKMDFRSNTMIEIGTAAANAAVSILLAMRGYGAFALAWGAFAQQIARVLISQWRNGFIFPWPPRFAGMRPMLKFGGGSSALIVSGAVGGRAPELILGGLINEAAVGLFARATGLAGQLRGLVSGAVASVFYPAFARVRDSGQPLGPHYERVVAGYCAVTWPAMAGLAVAAEPLTLLLYGENWRGAIDLVFWVAVSQMCFVALPLHMELPMLTGKIGALVKINLLDTAIALLFLAIASLDGLHGVAVSRLAYGLAWIALYAGFLQRLIGFDWARMLAIYGRTMLATGAAVAPMLLAYRFWRAPADLGFDGLVLTAGAGVVCWLAVLFAIRHPAAAEIRAILDLALPKLGLSKARPAA